MYDWLLSMCCEFLIVRSRVMADGLVPSSHANASPRVRSMVGWSSTVSALILVCHQVNVYFRVAITDCGLGIMVKWNIC